MPARRHGCFVVLLYATLTLIALRGRVPANILLPPRRALRTRIDRPHGIKAVPPFPHPEINRSRKPKR